MWGLSGGPGASLLDEIRADVFAAWPATDCPR